MYKLFKRIFQVLIGLLVLVAVTVIGLTLFVDPNQFKETIEKQAFEKTGHRLAINGPMAWKFFPIFSIEIKDIQLENAPPFKDKFLSAQLASANLNLKSLMEGKAHFNLLLDKPKVFFVRNSKGQSNWENFIQAVQKDEKTQNNIATQQNIENTSSQSKANNAINNTNNKENNTGNTTENHQDKKSLSIMLNNIKIDNAEITFDDEQKNNHYKIDQIGLTAEKIVESLEGKQNPISLKLNVMGSNKQPVGNIDLKASWSLNSTENSLSLKNLNLAFESPTAKGNINGDIKTYLDKLTPEKLTLQGSFAGKNLSYDKIKIDSFKGDIKAQNGLINITPLEIQLAQSTQHATVQVDLRGTQPKFTLTDEAHDFDIKHLLAMFDVKDKIEGKTNLKVNLSATGTNAAQLKSSLSGQSQIEIHQGQLHGVNLIKILKNAQSSTHALFSSLSKKPDHTLGSEIKSLNEEIKQNSKTAVGDTTPFNTAKANITIHNGSINNPALVVEHAEYIVNGEGNANLNTETIDYHTAVLLRNNPYPANDEIGNYLYKTPLPVKISGTFSNPVIRPDVGAYTSAAWSYVQQNVIKKAVQKNIDKVVDKSMGKLLNKVTGATNEENAESSPTVEKAVNDKVNKALGNILDKIKK